jgi:hypothetical protein
MMKSRLAHLALVVLGGATVVASVLSAIPRYAAIGGALALLIADARKAFAKLDTNGAVNLLFAVFVSVVGAHAIGCAHLAAVEAKCNVTTQDLFDVGLAAVGEDYEAALSPGAINKEFCVIKASASELLALRRPPSPPPAEALMMNHLQAWSVAHP